ncbi:uncharacterized protein AB9W97_010328 [Spinachia spinachia]
MNRVGVQEVLRLPHPELLNCLNEFVNLVGLKQTEVTLTTSSYPHPNVLVSGPRCLVQETQQALRSALASLTVDAVVLDGPGAQRYFQAGGRVAKELVESSCLVLIREQQRAQRPSAPIRPRSTGSPGSAAPRPLPGASSMTAGSLAVNKRSLEIRMGRLEDQQCYREVYRHLTLNVNEGGQAIFAPLTSDPDELTVTVGGSWTSGGGRTQSRKSQPRKPGSFPTSAIFHVRGENDAKLIEQLVLRIVENCEAFWFRSVAIPAICAGGGGWTLVSWRAPSSGGSARPLLPLSFVSQTSRPLKRKRCVIDRVSVPPSPRAQRRQQAPRSGGVDLSAVRASSAGQHSVFLFLGLSRADVDDAMTKLEDLYRTQCSTRTFNQEELAGLTQRDVKGLRQLVELEGLYHAVVRGSSGDEGHGSLHWTDGQAETTSASLGLHCPSLLGQHGCR